MVTGSLTKTPGLDLANSDICLKHRNAHTYLAFKNREIDRAIQ